MSELPHSDQSVWAVVLHWGAIDDTRQCLHSIEKLAHPISVVVVDNGSPDRAGDRLEEEFPQFHHLRLPDNSGFAGGCNAGARYSMENGADWIWFLNNDAEVDRDSLDLLIEQANAHPKAGALSACVYTKSATATPTEGIGIIDFKKGKTRMRQPSASAAGAIPAEWLSGCNLLVRAEAFRELGGLNEDYFLYFEDVDICHRLRLNGWQCLLVPQARVRHAGNASTQGDLSIWRAYYHTRNRCLFFSRYSSGPQAAAAFFFIGMHLVRHLLVLPWRGRNGRRRLRAELLGLRDYLQGRFGQSRCLAW